MSGVDRFDIKMLQKNASKQKLQNRQKTAVKLQIITEPEEYVTLQEEQQQEKEDYGRDDYNEPPFPGTSSFKAVYFLNDALKTFADYDKLVDIAARGYNSRDDYLSSGFENAIPRDKWVQLVYFVSKKVHINARKSEYKKFAKAVKEKQQLRLQSPREEFFDEPKFSAGYGLKTGSGFITCPDSVINDVSRLEVLIGGKRAGNNSPEIINGAAGICQRLFQG